MHKENEKIEIRKMSDGEAVRLATYLPEGEAKAKAVIQIIHGFGEHIGQYQTLIKEFLKFGLICVIHDQRGFGLLTAKNKKKQGVTSSYNNWLNDISEIRQQIKQDFPNLPVILFGHSLGGNIALNYLLDHQADYDRAIIESPWLGLYQAPPKILTPIARLVGKISPKIAVQTGLNMEYICHDQTLAMAVAHDQLFHTRLSMRLYPQIVDAGKKALAGAESLKLPILLFAAEEDHIVSRDKIREFARKAAENVKFVEIKSGYHLLHRDEVKAEFFDEIERFIKGE